jgi:hypothetical protein
MDHVKLGRTGLDVSRLCLGSDGMAANFATVWMLAVRLSSSERIGSCPWQRGGISGAGAFALLSTVAGRFPTASLARFSGSSTRWA